MIDPALLCSSWLLPSPFLSLDLFKLLPQCFSISPFILLAGFYSGCFGGVLHRAPTTNNKTFLIPGSSKYVLAILNSKTCRWFLGQVAAKMVGGAYAMQTPYVSQIPIPETSEKNMKMISTIVDYVLFLSGEIFRGAIKSASHIRLPWNRNSASKSASHHWRAEHGERAFWRRCLSSTRLLQS